MILLGKLERCEDFFWQSLMTPAISNLIVIFVFRPLGFTIFSYYLMFEDLEEHRVIF